MAPAPAPAKPGGQQQAPRPRSFLVGTQEVTEGQDYDQTVSTYGGSFPNWALTATGWLKGIWLDILITEATNAVVTVAAAENYPFNILGNIQLNDINNEAIFGPFDSYTAFLVSKYGGGFPKTVPATPARQYPVAPASPANDARALPLNLRHPPRFAAGPPPPPAAA